MSPRGASSSSSDASGYQVQDRMLSVPARPFNRVVEVELDDAAAKASLDRVGLPVTRLRAQAQRYSRSLGISVRGDSNLRTSLGEIAWA